MSFIAGATFTEIGSTWAFFLFLTGVIILVLTTRPAEGQGPINPFESINNKFGRFCCVWCCYLLIWLPFMVLLFMASINMLRISHDYIVKYPPPGNYVNNVHIHCIEKSGPTTVILLGGGSVPAFVWDDTQKLISEYTTVCKYDRAGYGWAFNGEKPYVPTQVADDLYHALKERYLREPYIIVAHSVAGTYAWAFASKYLNDKGGLVLVDAQNKYNWNNECSDSNALGMKKMIRGMDPIGMVRYLINFLSDIKLKNRKNNKRYVCNYQMVTKLKLVLLVKICLEARDNL